MSARSLLTAFTVRLTSHQARDVLFSLSGFSNTRCIVDDEVDALLPTEEDWVDDEPRTSLALPPVTRIHKQFFVQNTALAVLGMFNLMLRHPS